VTSFTSSLASPRVVNTAIGLSAAASGGTSPYQFKFVATVGSTTTTLQNWSATSTYTWTPTAAGNYTLAVWARSSGNTTDAPEAQRTLNYTISAALSVTSLTASVASPQFTNTAITFNAAASGGFSPYQFKFLSTVNGTTTTLRTWNSSASFAWTPTQAGSYVITVWARSSGNSADAAEASRTLNYTITAPFALTSLTSNLHSPQVAGTAITFTATSSGGQSPHQYKWWLYNGSAWSVLRNWATGNTFTWTPTQAGAGQTIVVWARSAEVTADTNAFNIAVPYEITSATPPPPTGGPLTLTSFTSNVPSPQPVGTAITFTAVATGA
jgi:hypothetical protein